MAAPELQQARLDLSNNVDGLSAELMPFDALDHTVSLRPAASFDSSLLKPFMGALNPDEFSREDQARYLSEVRSIARWQGGKAGDWDENKSLWVILEAESKPGFLDDEEDGSYVNLTLEDYSEAQHAWTALRLYANIIQSEGDWHAREGKLIAARVLGDPHPAESLVIPTLEQTVVLNGIVRAVCGIVQAGSPDMA